MNMAAVQQPYNMPPAMPPLNRRSSIESSCDLYADVERSVNPRRATKSRSTSPKRDQASKVDKPPPTRRAKSALFLYPQDSLEDDDRAPVARQNAVPRKSSTNSESTMATAKLLADDFEYEVSAEEVAQQLLVSSGHNSQQRSVRSRASSKEYSVRCSQKEGAKSSMSLRESMIKEDKAPDSTKRAKSRERKMRRSDSGKSQRSNLSRSISASKSRSRSRSKPRTSSERCLRSSGTSTRSSSKGRSQSQHQRTPSSRGPQQKEGRSLSPKRTDSGNSKDTRSLSPKRTDSGNSKPPCSSQQQSRQSPPGAKKGAKMVWYPEQGYMSRSTANIGSIERSSHSSHPRSSGRSSQTESRRKLEKKSSKKEKKDKEHKKDKKENTKPLTTRGWRAQMAQRFGRTPVTAAGITEASSYRANSGRRIPSTLFCPDDFAESVKDDLSVIS